MLLHQFPDLRWLKAQADARFANRRGVGGVRLENQGWPSVIMNARVKDTMRDNIRGPLSIFTNRSGNSVVSADKKRVSLTPGFLFISNADQPYTLEVHEKQETETFNIHFGTHFVEQALQSLFSTPAQMLEDQEKESRNGFGFHNRLIPISTEFQSIVDELLINGNDHLLLEEKLFQLLGLLFNEEEKVTVMKSRLTALKSSTKTEILRRLLVTTDYLYTHYNLDPSLDELARVSCVSKFHFLRLFKLAHGLTPHQFITRLKINKAKELLRNNPGGIKSIARGLGFDNASTFSRLFHFQTGLYPTQFRANL